MKRILFVLLCCLAVAVSAQPRYVFYLIGDGMGSNQLLAAEMYRAEMEGKIDRTPLRITQLPYSGIAATFSQSNGITDSSAAGTCLSTGKKTANGHLGTGPDNKPYVSIAEELHKAGWAVGIGTSVAVDHATPGAFYAHVPNRNDYYDIGTQLTESGYEFFGGAGFHQPVSKKDPNGINLYELCEKADYQPATTPEEVERWAGQKKKVMLIQKKDAMERKKGESIPFAIDRKEGDLSLSDITRTAIQHLSKFEKFFLMVEGGKIDYACHANDGATAIQEVLDFDKTVELAYEFYLAHPDETLIVVTADHETGGLALANSDYTLNLQVLQHQHVSSWKLGQEIREMQKTYGKRLKWEQVREIFERDLDFYTSVEISKEEDAALKAAFKKMKSGKGSTKTLYQNIDALSGTAVKILNKRAKLGWTTYGHSAAGVPVFAIGVGAERFVGWHDNSELAPMIVGE